jgi:hypothetical protein
MEFEGEQIIRIIVRSHPGTWLIVTTNREYTDGKTYPTFKAAWTALLEAMAERTLIG